MCKIGPTFLGDPFRKIQERRQTCMLDDKDWVGEMRLPSLCRLALKGHPKVLQIWRWHIQT
jgi:hypothetical protein